MQQYQTRNNQSGSRAAKVPDFLKVPETYVEDAESLMKQHCREITTSKLRNLLSMVSDVYNDEVLRTEEKLTSESINRMKMMYVRTAYECGRDKNTKVFVTNAHILEYLKAFLKAGTCTRQDLINFYHYMEALVAFHRYYGGREN